MTTLSAMRTATMMTLTPSTTTSTFVPSILPLPSPATGLAANPSKGGNKNWHDLPAEGTKTRWIDSVEELERLVPAWKRLTECTLCPNVFYEPPLLIPAIRALGDSRVRIAVVTGQERNTGNEVLCGLFPLEIHGGNSPWKFAKMWQHPYAYLSTPLIRSDFAEPTWKGLCEFLRGEHIQALTAHQLTAEGPFHYQLMNYLRRTGSSFAITDVYPRAMFCLKDDAEAFLGTWPGRKRHDLMRLERRLREMGSLEVRLLDGNADPMEWCEQFLHFEALGWKGEAGTAMIANANHAQFFRSAVQSLAAEGRLMAASLTLNGTPIAMKCNFMTHQGGFGFKIAYDPSYAKYSPGLILEMREVHRTHEDRSPLWIDSCAIPDHPMINAIWPDRRLLQSLTLSTGGTGSRFGVACIPALKAMKRSLTATIHALRQPFQRTPSSSHSKASHEVQ